MKYLLDTNVISETVRKSPDAQVKKWFETVPSDQLYLSVLSLGEIRRGIEKILDQERKIFLLTWLEHDLVSWFGERLIPVCFEVADKWGYITARGTFPVIDALLAATALTHNMKLVTRNVDDFQFTELEVINPWNF
ncbi:MAG: type II toxin-antitoxin system VapC family toxin [Proteobacteria bacterium]|nr:type II toxin-antitoxin system VapC family toxin [Pseudomonadota bacterium]